MEFAVGSARELLCATEMKVGFLRITDRPAAIVPL
jgi:hypothetical protein